MADKNESKEVIKIQFNTNADEAAKGVDNFNTSLEETTENAKENTKELDHLNSTYVNLKTQLKEANQELQKAVQIYGETSVEAIKAAQGVAELRDTMGAAADLTEAFNPDQKFKALGAATQLAATGVQGVTAGMALFGDQSEDTEKMLLKVQSAMAFSDAISSLSDLGDQWNVLKSTIASNSIAQKANTAATGAAAMAQNLFTGSVNTTSVGFKVLKGAIAATGIGLLVVGVAALIQNFGKIKEVVMNFVPGLAAVGEGIMSIVNSVTDFIGVTSEADRAVDRIKENAKKSSDLNKKFLAEHEDQLDEFTKAKLEAKERYNQAVQEEGADQVALAKRLNRELVKAEQDRNDEIQKKREEAAEKEKQRLEKIRKEEEDRQAKEKAAREKQAEENKRNAEFIAEFFKKIEEDKKKIQEQADKDYQDSLNANTKAQEEAFAKQKAQEEQKVKDKQAIDEGMLAQDKAIQEAQFGIAEKGVALVKDVFGKSKGVQKAAIIADSAIGIGKMVVANNTANIAALATPQAIATSGASAAPVIAFNNISTALGVASTIAATVKALQAVGGGGAPSAPATNSGPTGVSATPQTGFQASSENQIASSISQVNQLPVIKTFVVASDVTDQQTLDAKLVGENSFGGV